MAKPKSDGEKQSFFSRIGANIKKLTSSIAAAFKRAWSWFTSLFSKKDKTYATRSRTIAPQNTNISAGGDQTRVFDTSALQEAEEKLPKQTPLAKSRNSGKQTGKAFVPRKKKPNFVLGTIITTAKVVGLALILVIAAGVGAVFGVANAYLGTTPSLDLEQINTNQLNSYIYDANGTLITPYSGLENREYATLDEIPLYLQQAVIAVEDVRFYSHNGVDLKGLISALVGNFTGGGSVSGGSTLTQQLIKNKMLTTEKSYKRKIQEAKLALELESTYEKDQILEAYLNSIPLGGLVYGVKAAAKDYFNKDLNELTLKECACLAGITQNPYKYNPRRVYYNNLDNEKLHATNVQALETRIAKVLNHMYEEDYITLEQMNEALTEELVVQEKSTEQQMYAMPHAVEYAVSDVVTHLLKIDGLEDTAVNRAAKENWLRGSGYHIYTTIDPDIQSAVQTSLSEYTKYPNLRSGVNKEIKDEATGEVTIQPQSCAVVIENGTGNIRAVVGSRDLPTRKKSLNRAANAPVPVGSSTKPLTVYGPAFDKGVGLGDVIANIPASIKGWESTKGYPERSASTANGPEPVRAAITRSHNIAAARVLMEWVGLDTSFSYYGKIGITDAATSKFLQPTGSGLALGANSLTMMQMTTGYSCIANGGTYIEPMAFDRIEDASGNVVLKADDIRETHQVYEKSTAWMLTDVLTEAATSGTGHRARLSGMTTAGKTGTTHDNKGLVFAGYTPYYTSVVWMGHDENKSFSSGDAGTYAAPLWKDYMTKIHEGLDNKAILEGDASAWGVTTTSVCNVSGKKATSACGNDTSSGYVSASIRYDHGECDMHSSGTLCTVGHTVPGPYCPPELCQTSTGVVVPADSPYAELSPGTLQGYFSNYLGISGGGTTPGRDPATSGATGGAQSTLCPVHTYEWAVEQEHIATARTDAQTAINTTESFITQYVARLTPDQVSTLRGLISNTQTQMAQSQTAQAIIDAYTALNSRREAIRAAMSALPSPSPSPSASVDPSPSPSESPDPTASVSVSPSPSPSRAWPPFGGLLVTGLWRLNLAA